MVYVSSFLYALLLFFTDDFFPKWSVVSKKLIFFHWKIGKSLLLQGVLETISDKIDEVILTKFVGVAKLGTYSKGRDYSSTLGVIGSKFFARPWFSIMSKFSSNKKYFFMKYHFSYSLLILVGVFLIFGNYFFGEKLILLALGEKWRSLIELFNFFVVSIALYYLVTFNKYSILALGKPAVNLKLESYYAIFRFISLLIVFSFFRNKDIIIYLLILDILSRTLLIIFQAFSMSFLLSEPRLKRIIIFNSSIVLVLNSIYFFEDLKWFGILFITGLLIFILRIYKLYRVQLISN